MVNFPVLINITDTDLRDNAQSDGDDIAFTSSSDVQLNHEIELYTNTTGRLVAWVNVTSLSSSADTVIYMYYGNATCGSQQNAEGTWDANYVMVQHMNDATTSTIKDSTSNNNDGTKKAANEPVQVDGVIGKGQSFDGTNDYISVANHASLNFGANTDYTISAWTIYTDDNDINPIVNKRPQDAAPYIGYRMLIMNTDNVVRYSLNANNYDITCDWKTDANNYYVHTADRDGSIKLFDDGVNKDTRACPAENVDNVLNLFIGSLSTGGSNYPFNGIIDEVRISNIARNASWIATEYANMNSPSTFYEVGNSPPIITLVSPADGSMNNTLRFQVVVTVTDPDLDSFDITWYNNHSSGGFIDYQVNLTCTDGTFRYVFNESEDCNTKYWCRVIASDGNDTMNVTYDFTTMTDYWWGLECSGGGGGSFVNSNGGRIGIVGLCGVLGLVFFFIRRRKRND
jgi:hypothetical protein